MVEKVEMTKEIEEKLKPYIDWKIHIISCFNSFIEGLVIGKSQFTYRRIILNYLLEWWVNNEIQNFGEKQARRNLYTAIDDFIYFAKKEQE